MKKASLLIGLFTMSITFAQIRFEKGYFIDNSGTKTEVFIKNIDWKNNPKEFEYKFDNNSEAKKESIKNITEFGIDNAGKYIRKTVMIDYSSSNLNSVSDKRDPEFVKETLFLKYLVEGKTNLFYYENGGTRRFFYNKDQSDIQQLVYKVFSVDQSQIGYNEDYKKQLSNILECGIENKDIQRTDYRANDLTKLFMKSNACSSGNSINYTATKGKRDVFNLSIRPGISSSALQTTAYSYGSSSTADYDRKTSFRIGAEFEFILSFNKNKWSLFLEPTYQYYKSEGEMTNYPGEYYEEKVKHSVDYKSIDIPFGVRHYFFLNDQSKIFINGGYMVSVNLNSSIKRQYSDMKIESGNNLFFGAGYKYNDKFGIEFRVNTSRNILRNYSMWKSNYNSVSLILGYTLF